MWWFDLIMPFLSKKFKIMKWEGYFHTITLSKWKWFIKTKKLLSERVWYYISYGEFVDFEILRNPIILTLEEQ